VSSHNEERSGGPVVDVHAHYLPPSVLDLMGVGRAQVTLGKWCGVDGHIHLNGMPVGSTLDMLSSVDSMLAAMTATGVGMRVLSPPPFTYRYWADAADGLALCRLLNDATAAVVRDHPDAFLGLCTVPLQDPDAAVREFERAVDELGLVGVTLGTNVAGRSLADPALRPFLAAVADRGCPVLVHPDFVPDARLSDHYLINLVGLPTESAITLGNLLLGGVLQELPHLRIGFVHGGGTAPALLGRLDKGWTVRPESRSATDRLPSSQLGNVFFDTLTHSPQALRHLLDVAGPDRVMIGTDAPFDVEDLDPLGHLRHCPALTELERDTVLYDTAWRWLGRTRQGIS
jgi:aminocarboxymuconate-semialdehyde decarboxylase